MPTRTAIKSGNWSDTTVWSGGVKPTTGDSVALGGYTVTWDEDTAVVAAISNGTLVPGGAFALHFSGIIASTVTLGNGSAVGGWSIVQHPSADNTETCYIEAAINLAGTSSAFGVMGASSTTTRAKWLIYQPASGLRNLLLTHVRLQNAYYAILPRSRSHWRFEASSCDFTGCYRGWYSVLCDSTANDRITDCFFYANTVAAEVYVSAPRFVRCVFGWDRDGTRRPNTNQNLTADAPCVLSGCVLYTGAVYAVPCRGLIERINDGWRGPDDSLNSEAAPGSRRVYAADGTAAVTAGAFAIVPASVATATWPMTVGGRTTDTAFHAPIRAEAGAAVVLSVTVTPNASHLADSVSLALDPDDLFGLLDVSAQAVPAGEATTLTVSGTVPTGVGTVALDWEIRDWGYASGASLAVSAIEVSVGDRDYSLDFDSWTWQTKVASDSTRILNILSIRNLFDKREQIELLCEEPGP